MRKVIAVKIHPLPSYGFFNVVTFYLLYAVTIGRIDK